MNRLGRGELLHGELQTTEQVLAAIDAVTADDVRAVAADVLTRPLSLAVVGPFPDHDFSGAIT
jgi:predicted Zn-dependent peptidase